MTEPETEWFETAKIGERRIEHVSKFLSNDFVVTKDFVAAKWSLWTPDERLSFASAFSARAELKPSDHEVLDFLLEAGDQEIWRTIALSAARHRDRDRARDFLLSRIAEGAKPLANYYQALGMLLSCRECVPALRAAMAKHCQDVEAHPLLETWDDRLTYLDYLACTAVLFKITGQAEYRANLDRMLEHPDESVRQMVRTVANASDIAI